MQMPFLTMPKLTQLSSKKTTRLFFFNPLILTTGCANHPLFMLTSEITEIY